MNNENNKLEEQESPEKNTDGAFVQVGADGKPLIPDNNAAPTTADKTPKQGTVAD